MVRPGSGAVCYAGRMAELTPLDVDCPTCHRPAGSPCRSIAGHDMTGHHLSRLAAAQRG